MVNSSVIKDKNLITISFGDETRVTVLDKLYQHDKGQILQFKDIPDGAQVEFSNSKMEKSIPEIVKDGAVPVPNSIVAENETVDVRVKYIDENSETTVKEVKLFVINGKEADYEIDPENEQTFREEIEGILNETKDAAKEAADKVEVNRKCLDDMEKKSTDTIENITTVGEAQINAINDTAVSQIKAINGTAQAQIEAINTVAKQNIETGTNSIVQAAQGQIVGINQVANGQIDAINKTATSQIKAINDTAQAQSNALESQANEIYTNLGRPSTTFTQSVSVRHPNGDSSMGKPPHVIPRKGIYIKLDSLILDGQEAELGEDATYLFIMLSQFENGSGLNLGFHITEKDKKYDISHYSTDCKYINFSVWSTASNANKYATVKYTLYEYDARAELDEMQSDILSLQEELNGVRYLIIGNAEEVEV